MKSDVLNWLLDGPEWIAFAAKKQLLGKNPDVLSAINQLDIKRITDIVKSDDKGFGALKNDGVSYKKELFWYLFFLADIGFTAQELNFESDFKQVFALKSDENKFILSREMKPDYFCISSILLASMVKMSESIKGKLHPHIQTVMNAMRLDGGWHCAKSRAVGKKLQDSESCPMDNINILMLLGQYEQYKSDVRLNGAIDLLFSHWDKREEKHRPYGFGIGTQFKKLKYPVNLYGILQVLDVLSLYPYARSKSSYAEMLESVKQKAVDGKYYAESIVKIFDGFDFAQKVNTSRWITFIVNRIDARTA